MFSKLWNGNSWKAQANFYPIFNNLCGHCDSTHIVEMLCVRYRKEEINT